MPAHFDVSASWQASSLGDWSFGRRREIVWTEVNASLLRSVLRMWLPTAPVQPNTAAVVMLEGRQEFIGELSIRDRSEGKVFEDWGSISTAKVVFQSRTLQQTS